MAAVIHAHVLRIFNPLFFMAISCQKKKLIPAVASRLCVCLVIAQQVGIENVIAEIHAQRDPVMSAGNGSRPQVHGKMVVICKIGIANTCNDIQGTVIGMAPANKAFTREEVVSQRYVVVGQFPLAV